MNPDNGNVHCGLSSRATDQILWLELSLRTMYIVYVSQGIAETMQASLRLCLSPML